MQQPLARLEEVTLAHNVTVTVTPLHGRNINNNVTKADLASPGGLPEARSPACDGRARLEPEPEPSPASPLSRGFNVATKPFTKDDVVVSGTVLRRLSLSETASVSRPSWHPHVYGKPPRAPTPHSIADILFRRQPGSVLPIAPLAPLVLREEDEPLNLCVAKSRDASPASSVSSRTLTPPMGLKTSHGYTMLNGDPRAILNGRTDHSKHPLQVKGK